MIYEMLIGILVYAVLFIVTVQSSRRKVLALQERLDKVRALQELQQAVLALEIDQSGRFGEPDDIAGDIAGFEFRSQLGVAFAGCGGIKVQRDIRVLRFEDFLQGRGGIFTGGGVEHDRAAVFFIRFGGGS